MVPNNECQKLKERSTVLHISDLYVTVHLTSNMLLYYTGYLMIAGKHCVFYNITHSCIIPFLLHIKQFKILAISIDN